MLELRHRDIVGEIGEPRRKMEQVVERRDKSPAHQRPFIIDETGAQAGDERAEADLDQNQQQQRRRFLTQAMGGGAEQIAIVGEQAGGGPQNRGESDAGEQKVDRQPFLRHFDAMDEARGHHPPADEALERAKGENAGEAPAQAADDLAAGEEPQEGQGEDYADEPAQQAMAPLPGENGLEAAQVHVGKQFPILRDMLVFFECGAPVGLVQRRQDAGYRLPFGDGKAGFGQPRGAADDDHGENAGGDDPQPQADGAERVGDLFGSVGRSVQNVCSRRSFRQVLGHVASAAQRKTAPGAPARFFH